MNLEKIMRINLLESGIQNIRSLAKQYNKAKIYMHTDCDGVISALSMRYYLEANGIKVVEVEKIQYGGMEYAISKTPDDVLPVLVDFAHGKPFMKIHTDHHDSQIQYSNASKNFSHAKSNAGTISTIISPKNIFPLEDIRVVDMVDSAGYSDENIGIDELKNYIFQWNKDRTNIQNHLRFGMVVNKLLLAYKNKPGFLEEIVMTSKPSLVSVYQNILRILKQHLANGDKGWSDISQLQKNAEYYSKSQENNKLPENNLASIETMTYGQNALIGDVIVQIGGGDMKKTGSYDRYTAYKLYPNAKYFIMIWDSIGMMQVSKNNWNKTAKENDVHLGNIVIKDIFTTKYAPLLNKEKYDISLLAIKKTMEENIDNDNEEKAIGFDYNEFKALFEKSFDLPEDTQQKLEKCMNYKPSQLTPIEGDEEGNEKKMKIVDLLTKFTIPLPEIILKTSGGHPGITNLNGFSFLNTQQRINNALNHGRNPYEPYKKDNSQQSNDSKKSMNKTSYVKKDSTSLKILRSIAKDVVKRLNGDTTK
jgi:hypothetical protein